MCFKSSLLRVFGTRPRESPRNVRVTSDSPHFRPLWCDGPRPHSPPALHCRGPRCHGDLVAQLRPSPLDPFLMKPCPCWPAGVQTHRRLTRAACFRLCAVELLGSEEAPSRVSSLQPAACCWAEGRLPSVKPCSCWALVPGCKPCDPLGFWVFHQQVKSLFFTVSGGRDHREVWVQLRTEQL